MSCEHCGCDLEHGTGESLDELWARLQTLGLAKSHLVVQGAKVLDLTRDDPSDLSGFPVREN